MSSGSKTTFKSYIDEHADEPLISFDDEGATNSSDRGHGSQETPGCSEKDSAGWQANRPRLESDGSIEEVQPVDVTTGSDVSDTGLLCGYLNKYKVGARGLGKNFKKRWFVFVDNSCKLLYFRTPQDIVPLGEIDVSNASFNIEVECDGSYADGRQHVFEIRWVVAVFLF